MQDCACKTDSIAACYESRSCQCSQAVAAAGAMLLCYIHGRLGRVHVSSMSARCCGS
jgi:hypothetical protein